MSESTVWVIEDGEYSDYHIVGVFSSRENAETILAQRKSGEIVEWKLDPGVEQVKSGMTRFYVQMLRDGTVLEVAEQDFSLEEHDYLNAGITSGGIAGLRVWGFAKSEPHAIEIANEKRVQAIAEGKWPHG